MSGNSQPTPPGQAPFGDRQAVDGSFGTTRTFFDHSSGKRINTDAVITAALKRQYPEFDIVVVPAEAADVLAYAFAGNASATPIKEEGGSLPSSLEWTMYIPPAQRLSGRGQIAERLIFGMYMYTWKDTEFLVYLVDVRDGDVFSPPMANTYILTRERQKAEDLILEAGEWSNELRNEIWVYDGGWWSKNAELYQSIMNSSWDSVILDSQMKKAIIDDHLSFFNSKDTYLKLKVPWKRGIIYHGPPGNGKTISIKAMSHMLYNLNPEVPMLYVRTLASYSGPEYSVRMIFNKARQMAPCYLVLEDLDTIINDEVRSYFLNEVDGLKSNDGIFMVGSTNHLEWLDPGISKRPSRFDRKYFFDNPNTDERVSYCHFWQRKLEDNKDIEFPEKLCSAIAKITYDFSFAYIQEAFVATLLAIARASQSERTSVPKIAMLSLEDGWVSVDDDPLDKYLLWVEMKKQVAILREGMDDKGDK